MIKYLITTALFLICAPALAEVEVGIVHSTYDDMRLEFKNPGAILRIGGQTLYGWGAYEEPDINLVGQSMGNVDIWSGGIGVRFDIQRLRLAAGFGYYSPTTHTSEVIRNEAVQAHLNNNHGWETTRRFERTDYDIADGYGGRLVASYAVRKHVIVSVSVRLLRLTETMNAYVGECSFDTGAERHPNCDSWWRETNSVNLDAFEFGLLWRF